MKQRMIEIRGFKVEVYNFGYDSFYYPTFNPNAEFKVNADGFKRLRRYLGMIKWIQERSDLVFAKRNTE